MNSSSVLSSQLSVLRKKLGFRADSAFVVAGDYLADFFIPQSIGIIDLGENSRKIFEFKGLTRKIFRNKDLAPDEFSGLREACLQGWNPAYHRSCVDSLVTEKTCIPTYWNQWFRKKFP